MWGVDIMHELNFWCKQVYIWPMFSVGYGLCKVKVKWCVVKPMRYTRACMYSIWSMWQLQYLKAWILPGLCFETQTHTHSNKRRLKISVKFLWWKSCFPFFPVVHRNTEARLGISMENKKKQGKETFPSSTTHKNLTELYPEIVY